MTSGIFFDAHAGRWKVYARDGSRPTYARALMCCHVGRILETREHVHHINGDRTDDRIENLEIVDIAAHGSYHGRERWLERKERWQFEWSENYAACVDCGHADRPHQGRGLCMRCYSRVAMRERRRVAA